MSQNNTLSAKAQNIITKFINKNSHKSSISRTDVMKHAIVTLYAQMPEAKPELIAPFKDCIFDLHTHFTQEEIDVLVAECPQVIMYCFKSSGVMSHIDFNDRYNELAEDIISKDTPLNIYKTPESIIELCARLSGKPTANDKVYMPYSDFSDYALYYLEAEYHIECEDRSCGDDGILENYTNAYTQILLDSQRVKSKTVYGNCGLDNADILTMHPNYVFGCNPVLNQKCDNLLSLPEGMWQHPQEVTSTDLGRNICIWLCLLKERGFIDIVLPESYFYEAGIWSSLKYAFESKKMEFNATFITLSERLFDCECGDVFLLHIEKGKGNNGMIRLIDATGSEFYKNKGTTEECYNALINGDEERIQAFDRTNPHDYQMGGLNVDFLMDIINKKECDSKYEERMHYTQFFAENEHAPHQYIIDKKLPALAEGEKYITLRELVDVLPTPKVEEENCRMRVLEKEYLSSEYMDCDIPLKTLPQKTLNPTNPYYTSSVYFSVDKDCLILRILDKRIKIGNLKNVNGPVAIDEGMVPFKLKSTVVTEEFLLRELAEDYCSMQTIMLSEYREGTYIIAPDYFLDIKIIVPSLEEQERRCKNDVQAHLNDARAYLKEADRKIIQSAEEFQRDVHMKKHAIGQTLFNLGNWWDLLLKARKEGNGIVDDKAAIGKKNKVLVSDIYANIQMSLEKLQMQVDRFWVAAGFKVQNLSLDSFVKEYAASHQNPMFAYKCAIEPSLSGKNATEVKFAKEALTMVFDNIINNACCHGFGNADSDKNIVKIEVGTDDYPYVIISNNGQPFHEALTAEDVFTYGRSSNAGQNHYGIGGYEVRNIMRKFGGEAEFISTPEKEFTVSYKLTFKRTDNIQK